MNLIESSKTLISSLKTNQSLLNATLNKIKPPTPTSTAVRTSVSHKAVSFSDYLRETMTLSSSTPYTNHNKYRSKSAEPNSQHRKSILKKTVQADSEDDDDESYSHLNNDTNDDEEPIESDNLTDLIRFKELDAFERLKSASNEEEFLRHIEVKRQSFLKHNYSEEDENNSLLRGDNERTKKKNVIVKKTRSHSAPSYRKPTEASLKMMNTKVGEIKKGNVIGSKSSRKTINNASKKRTNKKYKNWNKPLLGFDFALGIFNNFIEKLLYYSTIQQCELFIRFDGN